MTHSHTLRDLVIINNSELVSLEKMSTGFSREAPILNILLLLNLITSYILILRVVFPEYMEPILV